MEEIMKKADIGLIGLAVMGENLVMNMERNGFTVAVFNRTKEKVTHFVEGRAKEKNIIGTYSIEEFVGQLDKPRKIMLMVKAGKPVDIFIDKLIPFLDQGDIIIDGGNSNYEDSIRRTKYIEEKGLLYVGTGVSGGEEGALNGPSIMPGGSDGAWKHIQPIFQKIAAKADDGKPCCDWIGANGAGHYVKMVHNGIEYGDMQLISEAYQLMKTFLNMSNEEMHEVFKVWNDDILDSYLIEITRDILGYKDENGQYVLDYILDTAGQKGTGKWTGISSLHEGVPLTLISEAVYARCLSAIKEERVKASKILTGPTMGLSKDKETFIGQMKKALYMAKIISYTQGYMLMREAAKTYGWELDYGSIASIWRGGCIIRSVFLDKIKNAYEKDASLSNLLFDDFFADAVTSAEHDLRSVVAQAVMQGISVPTLSAAITFYDGFRNERLPANLLQAQRDYFGAHTYERTDQPKGTFFHTNWTGEGGTTSSSTYQV